MKRRLIAAWLLLVLALGLAGCSFSFTEDGSSPLSTMVTVTLKPENGAADSSVRLPVGGRMTTPEAPSRAGWLFRAWCTDAAGTLPYDFSLAVTRDITLYASYLPDYEDWTNRLTEEAVPSLVLIRTKTRSDGNVGIKTGSGIVLFRGEDSTGTFYYLLTNHHVVSDAYASLLSSAFSVEDYRGGAAYRDISLVSSSADYDLAVLKMYGDPGVSYTLPPIPLAAADAPAGEKLAALGQPGGQRNALTYGEVLEYHAPNVAAGTAAGSAVTFPVLYHSAPITNGSSGGAVVNVAGELVAVNYAGAYREDKTFLAGMAIPVSRVRAYIATVPALAGLL